MCHGNAANFGRSSCDLACASKARSTMAAKPLASSSSSLEAEAAVPTPPLPLPLLPESAGCALSCPLLVTAPRLIAASALSCPLLVTAPRLIAALRNTRNWCMRTPANASGESSKPFTLTCATPWVVLRFKAGVNVALPLATDSFHQECKFTLAAFASNRPFPKTDSPRNARASESGIIMRCQWPLVVWPNRILRSRTFVMATWTNAPLEPL